MPLRQGGNAARFALILWGIDSLFSYPKVPPGSRAAFANPVKSWSGLTARRSPPGESEQYQARSTNGDPSDNHEDTADGDHSS